MAVTSIGALIVGSIFAITCLHIVFLWPMDRLRVLFPTRTPIKFVDDMTLVTEDVMAQAVEDAVRLATWLIDYLRDELQLEVSLTRNGKAGKTVCVTSSPAATKRIQKPCQLLGVEQTSVYRHLGLDRYSH